MRFFDPKEVLDTQLTRYGRHLLSKGIWKPKYYAFFDENVLYDAKYGNISENKNNAEKRIQDDTPSLKVQHSYTGREETWYNSLRFDQNPGFQNAILRRKNRRHRI